MLKKKKYVVFYEHNQWCELRVACPWLIANPAPSTFFPLYLSVFPPNPHLVQSHLQIRLPVDHTSEPQEWLRAGTSVKSSVSKEESD